MNNAPATIGQHQLAALSQGVDHNAVMAQVASIQKVIKAVMQEGVHYGQIPGTDQNSLYKQGSEVLLSAFHIAVEPDVEEVRTPDGHIAYRIRCTGRHMQSGIVIGIGVGECSTAEEKYAWRAAVCDAEFDDTMPTHRRVKWNKGKKGYNGAPDADPWSVKQVRTNPSDLANTCLKMAKKRAQIDMTLTSLAASDCFTQDLEDLPEEYREGMDGIKQRKPAEKPRNRYQTKEKTGAPSKAEGTCTEPQANFLKTKLKHAGKEESELLARYEIGKIEELPKAKVNDAISWLEGKTE